ncbi:MAG TPA: efflux RND transporter periplasmic adaptor subunit [Caulobacteraceae bacterium]
MRRLKPWQTATLAAVVLVIAVVAWRGLGTAKAPPEPPAPSALVSLAPIRQATIEDSVSAYGVIAGSAAASRTVSTPRAVIVRAVLVGPGQPVAAGAPLVLVENTPATQLMFRQAADAEAFAAKDLARVQRLYDQHLAANDQLTAAQKTVADAKAAVAAQVAAGAGKTSQTLTAPVAGIVGATQAAVGEAMAADAPLVSVIANGGLVAQLGVEPSGARKIARNDTVTLVAALDASRAIASRVAIIGQAVDPTSRLVSVTAPASGGDFALGSTVQAKIVVASHPGLLAPRRAIVFDENGSHLYVVRRGKAREVAVTPGEQQGDDVEVLGAVTAGDVVAVDGAYQLQDGMAVRTARP